MVINMHFCTQEPPTGGQAHGFKGATMEMDTKAD